MVWKEKSTFLLDANVISHIPYIGVLNNTADITRFLKFSIIAPITLFIFICANVNVCTKRCNTVKFLT